MQEIPQSRGINYINCMFKLNLKYQGAASIHKAKHLNKEKACLC